MLSEKFLERMQSAMEDYSKSMQVINETRLKALSDLVAMEARKRDDVANQKKAANNIESSDGTLFSDNKGKNSEMEKLVQAALADGVLTEKEKQVLFKRAQAEGIDLDEFEMVLDARMYELQKAQNEKDEREKVEQEKAAKDKSTRKKEEREIVDKSAKTNKISNVVNSAILQEKKDNLEKLIKFALEDGKITEKEKEVLFKKAQALNIDLDEFEMVLDARLVEHQKAEMKEAAKSAMKSNKNTSVRKCPSCGAIVQAFQLTCPDCGFKFEEFDTNASTNLLQEKIDELKADISRQISELEKKRAFVAAEVEEKKNLIREKYQEIESEIQTNNTDNKGFFASIASGYNDRKKRNQIQENLHRDLRNAEKPLDEITERIQQLNASIEPKINSIILNFPIPTNKADLFELVTAMSAHISSVEMDFLFNEWWNETNVIIEELNQLAKSSKHDKFFEQTYKPYALSVYAVKYKEALAKIQILFANDDTFGKFIKDKEERQERLKKQNEERRQYIQDRINKLKRKILLEKIWSITWKVGWPLIIISTIYGIVYTVQIDNPKWGMIFIVSLVIEAIISFIIIARQLRDVPAY